jgi:general stress protein 26
LKKLLDSFDTAMLVTVCNDKLRARPMAIGSYDDKGDLWFVTG